MRLWHDRDFRKLWAGQTASQVGEHAGRVVLPLVAVVALDAGADQVGVLRAVEQAPILLFSLLAGVWVDRWRTRTVMVLADVGRAALLAAITLSAVLGLLGMPLLLVAAFAIGVFTVFFDVAYHASLVRLVRRDQLMQANSALESSRSAAQIGGPALGGALVSLLSASTAALASAALFAVSALSLRGIRRREPVPGHGEHPTRIRREIVDGLRFVAGSPSLRAVGLASAAYQFCFAALMTVYLLFLVRTLELPGAVVGLVLAAMGPGAVLGSLLSAGLPRRFGYGVVLVSSAALADVALMCVPAVRGSGLAPVLLLMGINVVFGACSQVVNIITAVVRQAVTPVRMQGRVVATINFVGMGLMPFGSLCGGYLGEHWGLRPSLLVAAVGLALSPLVLALSPLARLGRSLPVAPEPGQGVPGPGGRNR
ncbi:MFS transporter [Pseudonocardia kunmingensis]|uniref:MFS transporter n=1 Tax=Pseudonocardia kunmingensis TaxID=630975 RepID=UPI001B8726A0|nr:MFS transporter [Pseudonocardia kunmingensis]